MTLQDQALEPLSERERRYPLVLASYIGSELTEDMFTGRYSLRYAGEEFELGEATDDPEELILVRKRDGKRYRIEIEVFAEELTDGS